MQRLRARRGRAGRGRRRTRRGRRSCSRTPAATSRTRSPTQIDGWPAVVESYSGDEQVVKVRDKEIHTKLDPGVPVGQQDPPGRAAPLHRPRRAGALLAPREPARLLPLHRRACSRSSATTRTRPGCSPARATRSAPTAASSCSSDGQPATRLSTAFDSVTLYGRDPDPRPDIYGKVGTSGVSVATLDDMKALYDGFDLVAPTTRVSMTINGPAPTILAFFLNTVIDQQVDRFRRGAGPRARRRRARRARGVRPGQRARHRAGRHPQGGPGPEHLPVLHRVLAADDGRHPGVVHRAAGPQLLLGLDLRLPHRRGRGEPDQPARVHPGQRVHLRRGLPRARHGHRRLRAQPVVLLLQRHGPGVLRARPRRPPDLGGRDAGEVRRQRALAEAEVPRPDLRPVAARAGDGLQRHPHHAAGADRDLRQRQQPAHQRLRRGGHHPDRGVGAPGAGDPADHQPRVGPGDEREPAPGVVHHRRAHRPRRGGGARRVRPDQRARRRARRDGDRLPARPHPGRVDALRAPQARRLAADHRRQHLPQARVRRRHRPTASSWPAPPRPRSSPSSQRVRELPGRRTAPRPTAALARLKDAAVGGENVFAVLMDAARVCSLQQVTEAFFEVGGQYRRNV